MYIRWTKFSCPHCGRVFERSLSNKPVRVGPGLRVCASKNCGRTFQDGSKEWPQLTKTERVLFLLPPGAQILLGVGLLSIILPLWIWWPDVSFVDLEIMTPIISFFLIPVGVIILFRWKKIASSEERHFRTSAGL